MQPNDPLHAYARRRMASQGAPTTPAEMRRQQRAHLRRECEKAFWIAQVVGLFMVGLGGVFIAVGLFQDLEPARRATAALFTGMGIAVLGLLLALISRPFRVPWDLENQGRIARAVVVSLKSGPSLRQGKYGPAVVSIVKARLAVQVDGGPVYETEARTVLQLHGPLVPGQEIAVWVDPANPRRVLVCEARTG